MVFSLIESPVNRNSWSLRSAGLRLLLCSLLLATLGTLVLTSQPLHAQSTVDAAFIAEPTEVTVGDVFTLTLQIIHPADAQISMSPFDSQWGSFEIRQFEPLDTIQDAAGNEAFSTQTLRATLWMTGTHTTPAYPISVADDTGSTSQYDVRPATVMVTSVLQAGDDALRDIKPQATLPFTPRWVQMLLAAVLCAVVLGALIWWLRRRTQDAPDQVSAPAVVDKRPADVKALEALQEIADRHLPTQRLFAEHYDLVTDVLRRYLDDGFKIPALDQTTSELRYSMPNNVFDDTHKALLFALLEEADLVKFAQVEPDFSQADHLPERARQFILSTAHHLQHSDDSPHAENGTNGQGRAAHAVPIKPDSGRSQRDQGRVE